MVTRDKLYIGGTWVDPSDNELLEIRSPHDQSVLGQAAQATNADIDRAVAVARQAFDHGPWSRTSPEQRQEIIRRLNTLREARADEVATAISTENGSALWFTKMGQPFLTRICPRAGAGARLLRRQRDRPCRRSRTCAFAQEDASAPIGADNCVQRKARAGAGSAERSQSPAAGAPFRAYCFPTPARGSALRSHHPRCTTRGIAWQGHGDVANALRGRLPASDRWGSPRPGDAPRRSLANIYRVQ